MAWMFGTYSGGTRIVIVISDLSDRTCKTLDDILWQNICFKKLGENSFIVYF